MGFFNANEFKDEDLYASGGAGGVVPEGDYMGKVTKTEVKTAASGSKYVSLQVKLDNGQSIFERLNLEHPTAGEFAKKALARIIKGGITNAGQLQLNTIEEVATTLQNVPVAVTVKHRGPNDKGYMQYNLYFHQSSSKVTVGTKAAY